MCRPSTRLLDDTQGLATVEYIVILMLIAVGGFTAWQGFGATVEEKIGLSSEAIAGINPSDTGAGSVGGSMEGFAPSATSDPTDPASAAGPGAPGDDASEAYRLGPGDGGGLAAGFRGAADGAADFAVGIADSLVAVNNAGWWLWEKARHPLDSAAAVADAVSHAVTNPRETVQAAANVMAGINKAVYDAGADLVRACVGGDVYTCNRGVVNVGLNLLPASAAGTVLKGGKQIAATAARTTNGASRFGWARATPESIKSYKDAPIGQRFYGLLDTKTGEVHFRPSEMVNANRANLEAGTAGHMSLGNMVDLPRGSDALGFSVTKTANGPTATYRSSYNMLHPDDALKASDVGMRLQPSRHIERSLRELREQGQNQPIGISPDGW